MPAIEAKTLVICFTTLVALDFLLFALLARSTVDTETVHSPSSSSSSSLHSPSRQSQQMDVLTHRETIYKFFDHFTYLRGEWIAVFTLLLLWTVTLLAKFIVTSYERTRFARPRERFGSGRATTRGPRGAAYASLPSEGGPIAGTVGGEEVEEGGELGDEDFEKSMTLSRLTRASQAARTSFLLLLTAVTITSLPIEYACPIAKKHHGGKSPYDLYNSGTENEYSYLDSFADKPQPGVPAPLTCGVCLTNSATTAPFILSWIFAATGLFWYLMEIFSNAPGSAMARTIMTLLAQPIIVVIFAMTFNQWNTMKRRGEELCPEGVGPAPGMPGNPPPAMIWNWLNSRKLPEGDVYF